MDKDNKNSIKNKIRKIHIIAFILFGLFLVGNIIFFFTDNCYGCTMNLNETKLNNSVLINNSPILKSLDSNKWWELYSNRDENTVVLDLRTFDEYSQNNINGSINIDYYNSNFKSELNKLDKNKTYLIYCRSGSRSGKTLDMMDELGFNKVYNLKSGIISLN